MIILNLDDYIIYFFVKVDAYSVLTSLSRYDCKMI